MATPCNELEHKAREAFVDDDFALAAALYTQAIAAGPPTAALYADRAQAYTKIGDFAAAAADAARAVELDPAMARAHLRRAHACVKLEHVAVEFGEQMLSVSVEVPGEAAYHLQPRLFGKIVPDKCRFAVLSTKIEVRLAKAEPGTTWTSLEFTDKPKFTAAASPVASGGGGAQRPCYPSSSSRGRKKDWDKVEAQVKKEEKEEKLDGDAAANRFFQDIFGNADEDMRRAMMKSFQESNGTVLSTDWKDVGSKKIEPSPPEGMHLRKWEY